jgi:hypothetical protein
VGKTSPATSLLPGPTATPPYSPSPVAIRSLHSPRPVATWLHRPPSSELRCLEGGRGTPFFSTRPRWRAPTLPLSSSRLPQRPPSPQYLSWALTRRPSSCPPSPRCCSTMDRPLRFRPAGVLLFMAGVEAVELISHVERTAWEGLGMMRWLWTMDDSLELLIGSIEYI